MHIRKKIYKINIYLFYYCFKLQQKSKENKNIKIEKKNVEKKNLKFQQRGVSQRVNILQCHHICLHSIFMTPLR